MPGSLRYQNPELQDLLASNYVIGTLRGAARKRMEALMREDVALTQRVRQWESKLQPLHQATPPLQPQRSSWQSIAKAISGVADNQLQPLLQRLNFYRYLSAMALSFALIAAVMLWYPGASTTAPGINYVAVLNNTAEQPAMVVTLTKAHRQLALDMLQKPQLAADQHLQLWAISREDGRIRSLGTLPLQKRVETALDKAQWSLIATAEYLLVSAETQPDVQAPGKQIIAKGLCVKVEGWKS